MDKHKPHVHEQIFCPCGKLARVTYAIIRPSGEVEPHYNGACEGCKQRRLERKAVSK